VQEVAAELLQQAAQVDPKTEEAGWVPHALRVVQQLQVGGRLGCAAAQVGANGPAHTCPFNLPRHTQGQAAIEEFVRGWRLHFLETMRPRFLPPFWSVDSRVANSDAPGEE
jgi:hypothetical protein